MEFKHENNSLYSENDDEDQEYSGKSFVSEYQSITKESTFPSTNRRHMNLNNLQMYDNFMNFNNEMISGDEEEASINSDLSNKQNSKEVRKSAFQWNNVTFQTQLKYLLIRAGLFVLRVSLKCLTLIKNIILLKFMVLTFFANLPFVTMKNLILFLKCYTNSSCIHLISLKIIPTVFNYLTSFIQAIFVNKKITKVKKFNVNCSNENNNPLRGSNNLVSSEISEGFYSRIVIYLLIGLCLISVMLFCSFYPMSKMYKVQSTYQKGKSRLLEHADFIFLLPGKHCMGAGECCKGYLEGVFRWSSCLVTTPIRIILTIWFKRNVDVKIKNDGLSEIEYYIERMDEDIDQMKDNINYQEEILLQIQNSIINFEQNVHVKANFVNKLKLRIKKLTEILQKLKKEVEISMNNLKKVINLKKDIDKMVDSVTQDSHDSAILVTGSLNRIKNSLISEQQKLLKQIENLENILKNDQIKAGEKNLRVTQKIQTKINSIKNIHQEIKKQVLSLSQIQLKCNEMTNNLNEDIRNKFNEEMFHHEQMSKRTEKMCLLNVEKLNNKLIKAKSSLVCFINKTILKESNNFYIKLRKDILDTLHDRTVETAKRTVEQALIKQTKTNMRNGKNIKKCGILSHVFNISGKGQKCLKDNKLLVDTNALCKLDQFENSAIEDQRLIDPVDKIIDDSLNLILADDIGKADFALESSGGSIIIERSTLPYTGRAAFLSLFGFTFGKVIKSIRKIIQPGNFPGECWAFQGDTGQVVIRLAKIISITAVTIDHASRLLTPDSKIMSAPKKFRVYALSDSMDELGIKLGDFEYDQNGDPIQTFFLEKKSQKTNYVQIRFLTNHGNDEYTCIYRVRVHGINDDK